MSLKLYLSRLIIRQFDWGFFPDTQSDWRCLGKIKGLEGSSLFHFHLSEDHDQTSGKEKTRYHDAVL